MATAKSTKDQADARKAARERRNLSQQSRHATRISGKRLAEEINHAERVTVLEEMTIVPDEATDGATITINLGGHDVSFQVRDVRINLEDLNALSTIRTEIRRKYSLHKNVTDPSVAFLRENDLPLYWNKDWLRARLDELGTFAAIAREYRNDVQGVNPTTIANYARDTFKIHVRQDVSRQRDAVLEAWERAGGPGGDLTQAAIANKRSISVSTVNRWIKDARTAYEALQQLDLKGAPKKERERTLEELAQEHSLQVATLERWLKHGTTAYDHATPRQTKKHYYSKDEYAKKRDLVRQLHRQHGEEMTKKELAEKANVDRSTITKWLREDDAMQGRPTAS